MVADAIALVSLCAATLGEWLHVRRVRRVRYLAFGPRGAAESWSRVAPAARVLGLSVFLWGCATLYEAAEEVRVMPRRDARRLVLALDVSPSMRLRDAGPLADQTREDRARKVLGELLESVAETCRISVVAFYHKALPVVVDTVDRDIIDNLLAGLPLAHAFAGKRPTTNVVAGIQGANDIAAGWPPSSTTLVLVTDGDSEEANKIPVPPPSIHKVFVLGFGSVHGRVIAEHNSAQRAGFLRSAAERLAGGRYYNCNASRPPPELLSHLASRTSRTTGVSSTRFALAVAAVGGGAVCLALVTVLLCLLGSSWKPGVPQT